MKTEEEIREEIKDAIEKYQNVLNLKIANIREHPLIALKQLRAISLLDAYYFVIGEERPEFECNKIDAVR